VDGYSPPRNMGRNGKTQHHKPCSDRADNIRLGALNREECRNRNDNENEEVEVVNKSYFALK
jgi:hypothetical protein